MPSAGFEHSIPAIKWLQTYKLDRTATGIGIVILDCINYYHYVIKSINRMGCLLSRHSYDNDFASHFVLEADEICHEGRSPGRSASK